MIVDALWSLLPGLVIDPIVTADRQETLFVQTDRLIDVCRLLRDRPELGFNFLADLTAVDFWPREPRFEVVYLLASPAARLRLKVAVPGSAARLPTVPSVWCVWPCLIPSALWTMPSSSR